MTGLQILDLVIGVVFIYFLLSLFCSTIQEILSNLRDLRYKTLESWMLRTFQHNAFGHQILNHPIIQGLSVSGKPSYIPSDKFAQAVLDMVHSQVHGDRSFDINSLRDALEKTFLLPPALKRYILQSVSEAGGEVTKVRGDLAKWYDDAMERVGGFYKKKAQVVIIWVSIAVSFAFNADTIRIAKYLYDNPAAASQLADQASKVATDTVFSKKVDAMLELKRDSLADETVALKDIRKNLDEINALVAKIHDTKLPLGWKKNFWCEDDCLTGLEKADWILQKIAGLLLTALAVSLGAPFWFELLNKLVNLRNAGNKPKTAQP